MSGQTIQHALHGNIPAQPITKPNPIVNNPNLQQLSGYKPAPLPPSILPFQVAQGQQVPAGFPMPNTTAARWESRPVDSLAPTAPWIGPNANGQSFVNQMQALQNKIDTMAKSRGSSGPQVRRSQDSLGTSG